MQWHTVVSRDSDRHRVVPHGFCPRQCGDKTRSGGGGSDISKNSSEDIEEEDVRQVVSWAGSQLSKDDITLGRKAEPCMPQYGCQQPRRCSLHKRGGPQTLTEGAEDAGR